MKVFKASALCWPNSSLTDQSSANLDRSSCDINVHDILNAKTTEYECLKYHIKASKCMVGVTMTYIAE